MFKLSVSGQVGYILGGIDLSILCNTPCFLKKKQPPEICPKTTPTQISDINISLLN